MNIEEAREILDEDFTNLSDSQILALIDLVDAISRYVLVSEF